MQEMRAGLQFAQQSQSQTLEEHCLGLMGYKLASVLGHWGTVAVGEDSLAALDSRTLACLLGKTLQSVESVLPLSQHAFDVLDGSGGSGGGFIFAIPAFSKQPALDCIDSPWVEIGDFRWCLEVCPGGRKRGWRTHLSGEYNGLGVAEQQSMSAVCASPNMCFYPAPSTPAPSFMCLPLLQHTCA
jgi:hypothetical protein